MLKKWQKAIAISALCLGILAGHAPAQGTLRFCLRSEPKTFDPLKVEDDASVAVRYLTGGVLVRLNRQTQALEPELAQSWKVSKDARQIYFKIRSGVAILRRHPIFRRRRSVHRPTVDGPLIAFGHRRRLSLGPGRNVETKIVSPTQISITFPAPVRDWTAPSIRLPFSPLIPPRRKWRCWAPSWSLITNRAQPFS